MGAHVLYDVSINKDDSISKSVAQKSGQKLTWNWLSYLEL